VPRGETRPPDSLLSVYSLNVHGELSRGVSALLQDIPKGQDILVFTETWLGPDASAPDIEGYTAFNYPRTKRTRHTRGGICLYIKSHLAGGVSVPYVDPLSCYVGFKVDIFVAAAPSFLFLFCVYLPPDDLRILSAQQTTDFWRELSDNVADTVGRGHTLVVGDLNARTANSHDFPVEDSEPMGSEELFSYAELPVCTMRRSSDPMLNPSGRRLLELCKLTGMRIANGRTLGDEQGALTFLASGGSGGSVVDYVLGSPNTLPLIHYISVIPAPVSDHHAVVFSARISINAATPPTASVPQAAPIPPRMRGAAEIKAWADLIGQPEVVSQLALITSAAENCQISNAVQTVGAQFDALCSQTWKDATRTMTAEKSARAHRHPTTQARQPKWWTPQLRRARQSARQALTRQPRSAGSYELRREYQRLLQQARRRHNRQEGLKTTELMTADPTLFWRQFNGSKKSAVPLGLQDLYVYFSALFAAPAKASSAAPPPPCSGPHPLSAAAAAADASVLNVTFCAAEVIKGIESLRRGKSTVCLLSLEALRLAAPQLAGCIAALFNACATAGSLPEEWALCTVTPIHKGGDAADAGNYRGIAVGSLLAKLYASLLNIRLTSWTETNLLRARGQAGFRKGYRTADQVFVLRTLIEAARLHKDPLFACYVDFKKAYDTVPRSLLWQKMHDQLGISGLFLTAMQALYASVPMAVSSAEGLSEVFHSHLGLKQGCPLSPLLFGIYIDDFERVVEEDRTTLCLPVLAGTPVPPPFYADDLGLVSEEVGGLQAQLDLLAAYSDKWGLTVNVAKTKVVVYLPTSKSTATCNVTYKGVAVEIVESFSYLGVKLHGYERISEAAVLKAESGQRAVYVLLQRCRDLHIHDPVSLIKLFKALVLPIMEYGHEIWGPSMFCYAATATDSPMEKVFRRFLRRVLGLRAGTPVEVMLAEVGQYPLRVNTLTNLARFWNRFVAMDDGRLAKQAFLHNVGLTAGAPAHNQLRSPWASQMVHLLDLEAAAPLAADGTPQHVDVHSLRIRLQSAFLLSLRTSTKSMTIDYVSINPGRLDVATYAPAPHLQAVRARYSRQSLTQLRTGSHWLAVATAIWAAGAHPPRHERLCSRCPLGEMDDAAHMIWGCPALQQQRNDHPSLFVQPSATLADFFQQSPTELASFAKSCRKVSRQALLD
jgi:hypothetical protein